MEFIVTRANEAVAGTMFEEEIYLPSSKTETLAMLIHKVAIDITSLERIDATQTMVIAGLSKRSNPSSTRYGCDPAIIAGYGAALDCGMMEGTLSEFKVFQEYGEQVTYFDPPILIARDRLWLVAKTYNQLSLTFVTCVIGYTLEKVTRDAFIAALVS